MRATLQAPRTAARPGDTSGLGEARGDARYLAAIHLIECLNAQLLDVVRDELDRRTIRDVNAVQALLLFNLGDREMTAGELRARGCYTGSNVSYTLKKLVDSGHIHHERSDADHRTVLVRLTPRGKVIRDVLDRLFGRHAVTLAAAGDVSGDELATIASGLGRLERFWVDQIRFRL